MDENCGNCASFSSSSADDCGKLKPNDRINEDNDGCGINRTLKDVENVNGFQEIRHDSNLLQNNNFTSFELENQDSYYDFGSRESIITKFIDLIPCQTLL